MMVKSCNEPIIVRDLVVIYGKDASATVAVQDLNLRILPGEFVCLLGTTGCGKSTILNVMAGFVQPTRGSVSVGNRLVVSPGPERGVVFQQHSLFPWKTVRGNVEFGLRMRGVPREQRRAVTERYMRSVGLIGSERAYPSTLSGGMQQRVGLVRALANDPSFVLMDEPFGSLDAQTRLMMQELLLQIWDEAEKTVVFVTHDVDEAIFLADRIVVLTARPATVKEEVAVTLPRPRSYEIVTSAKYVDLKKSLLELIREETLKSMNSRAR
jgi:NitT/TauT family transport system ATP-binding protein